MPMDTTDNSLIKGIVFFAILGIVVYFYPLDWPFEGYQVKAQKLDDQLLQLQDLEPKYHIHYPPSPPAAWQIRGQDLEQTEPKVKKDRREVAKLIAEYEEKITHLKGLIKKKQADNRMQFAKWTDIPKTQRERGVYFTRKYYKVREDLQVATRRANVDLDDPDIGFKELTGDLRMPKAREEELLRQLFIAETVVTLCIEAKKAEQAHERARGRKSEAFMRIISVAPEESAATGPFKLIRNPHYRPDEKNPRSKHFRKYFVRKYPNFIQEYPILIRLQCDVNSFMRFLYSVRKKGQFLVIRNLQITSPFLAHSLKDRREFERWIALERDPTATFEDTDDVAKGKKGIEPNRDVKKGNLIWVEMSAAGMDFFDPSLGSLHGMKNSKEARRNIKRTGTRRRPVRPSGH